jgi:hypothetical protein
MFAAIEVIKEIAFSMLFAGITGILWFGFPRWRNKAIYEKIFCVVFFLLFWGVSALLLWIPIILALIQVMIFLDGSLYFATSEQATILCFAVALVTTLLVSYRVMRFLRKHISDEAFERLLG